MIPLSAVGMLYLVTKDGRTLEVATIYHEEKV